MAAEGLALNDAIRVRFCDENKRETRLTFEFEFEIGNSFTLEEDPRCCKCGVFEVYRILRPYDCAWMDNALLPGTYVQYPPVGRVIKDLHLARFLLVRLGQTAGTFSIR